MIMLGTVILSMTMQGLGRGPVIPGQWPAKQHAGGREASHGHRHEQRDKDENFQEPRHGALG